MIVGSAVVHESLDGQVVGVVDAPYVAKTNRLAGAASRPKRRHPCGGCFGARIKSGSRPLQNWVEGVAGTMAVISAD